VNPQRRCLPQSDASSSRLASRPRLDRPGPLATPSLPAAKRGPNGLTQTSSSLAAGRSASAPTGRHRPQQWSYERGGDESATDDERQDGDRSRTRRRRAVRPAPPTTRCSRGPLEPGRPDRTRPQSICGHGASRSSAAGGRRDG